MPGPSVPEGSVHPTHVPAPSAGMDLMDVPEAWPGGTPDAPLTMLIHAAHHADPRSVPSRVRTHAAPSSRLLLPPSRLFGQIVSVMVTSGTSGHTSGTRLQPVVLLEPLSSPLICCTRDKQSRRQAPGTALGAIRPLLVVKSGCWGASPHCSLALSFIHSLTQSFIHSLSYNHKS